MGSPWAVRSPHDTESLSFETVSSSDSSGQRGTRAKGGEAKVDEGPPKVCNCISVRLFLFVVCFIDMGVHTIYLIFSDLIRFEDGLKLKFDFMNTLSIVFAILAFIAIVMIAMASNTYFRKGAAATIEMHPNMLRDEPDQETRARAIYITMAIFYVT
ncbi:hypothetical protein GCK32_011505, partial [Trichostrongylus colubriformis]